MKREDIDTIIKILCPNDEDFEKPIISPAYLKKELEALALEQEPCEDAISREQAIKQCGFGMTSLLVADCLRRLPPVTPTPTECEDAVSREAVLNMAYRSLNRSDVVDVDDIEDLPPVTPKQRTGKWIDAKVGKLFPSNDFKCSECGNILNFDGVNCGRGNANFCPNCGAKMEMEGESE